MRTTISIDDELLRDAKRRAVEAGVSLSEVVQDALRTALQRARPGEVEPYSIIPLGVGGSGVQPGVDLDDSAALLDLMEGTE